MESSNTLNAQSVFQLLKRFHTLLRNTRHPSGVQIKHVAQVEKGSKAAYRAFRKRCFKAGKRNDSLDDLGRTITLFSSTLFNYYLRQEMVKRLNSLKEKQLLKTQKLLFDLSSMPRIRKTINSIARDCDDVQIHYLVQVLFPHSNE